MKIIDKDILDVEFITHEKINKLSTFHTKGVVKGVFYPKNSKELIAVVNHLTRNNIKFKIIGNGSNILISPQGAKSIFISTKKLYHYIRFKESKCFVSSGVSLNQVYIHCLRRSLSGFENLAGIPGTIGGTICSGSGAFGSSIFDHLDYIRIFQDGKIKKIKKSDIEYGYRSSSLKNTIILSACFTLEKKNQQDIREKYINNCNFRIKNQPKGYSCGSIFKNPKGFSAGWLIEKCGLKNITHKDACISEKHANFIINNDNASFYDIKYLIDLCKKEVYRRFSIRLDCEVEIY